MRIALIAEVFLPKIDGVVLRTANLIRQLRAMGDEVLVFCPQGGSSRDAEFATVEFPGFPCPTYPEYRIASPDDRLISELDRFQPDVVHFVNPLAFGFRCYDQLAAAGRLRGAGSSHRSGSGHDDAARSAWPCVFSFHTLYGEFVKRYGALRPLSRLLWWMTREYHNAADLNLTVSGVMVDDLSQRGFERVRLWHPAVDSDLFHPSRANDAMRRRLSAGEPERPLLVTASRLAPEKNVEFLADVLRRVPKARLAIVGDGPHRSALERHFRGLPVAFAGYLKGSELASAYASSDLFVYASETETMGNVVLEAMSAGLAVIAPRAGGIPSLVEDGRTGSLFRPGDADQAGALVSALLDDSGLRSERSEAARQWAAERNWRTAAARVREDYRSLLEGAGDSRPLHAQTSSVVRRQPSALASALVVGLVTLFRTIAGAQRPMSRATRKSPAAAPSTVPLPASEGVVRA